MWFLYSETWEETREFLTKYATDVNSAVSLLVHWHDGEEKKKSKRELHMRCGLYLAGIPKCLSQSASTNILGLWICRISVVKM